MANGGTLPLIGIGNNYSAWSNPVVGIDSRSMSGVTDITSASDAYSSKPVGMNDRGEFYNAEAMFGEDNSSPSDDFKWLQDLVSQYQMNAVSNADRANAFSERMAREQMAFQERMSNTALDRYVEQLERNGFNKLLAVNGGVQGASTPSGSSAQGVQAQTPSSVDGIVQLIVQGMKDAQATLDRDLQASQFDQSLTESQRKARKQESLQTWSLITGTIMDIAGLALGQYNNSASRALQAQSIANQTRGYTDEFEFGKGWSYRKRYYD